MKTKIFYLLFSITILYFTWHAGRFYEFTHQPVDAVSLSSEEQPLVNLINKVRDGNGLPQVYYNDKVAFYAQRRAEDLVAKKQWEHDGFVEATRELPQGFHGENLARDICGDCGAYELWMVSDKHRENILNERFKSIGIGRDENYIVLWFADY